MKSRLDPHMPGAALLLFLSMALLFLPWIGEILFNSKGEPREAIVAVSILESGDWILPTNYGGDIPFKPPFLAWLMSIFAIVFNGGVVSEYISRLPSVVALMAMVMGGYVWARRERSTRFALIFSFVTFMSVEVFRSGFACRLDMVLTACMVGGLYVLYGLRRPDVRFKALRWFAAWALFSCAALTKGPVGSMLPCFAMGIYALLRGDRFFPTLGKMLGLALAALLPLAWWFYVAAQQGGQHFVDLMMEENIGRLIGTMSYDSHVQPIYYNFLTILAGMLPWTLAVLMAAFAWRRWRRSALTPAGLFSLVVAVTVILFYCIPESKRSVYLLPAYPFMAYAVASILYSGCAARQVRAFTWFMAVLAVLAPLAVIALQIWPQPKIVMAPLRWWNYIVLTVPVGAGVAWMINRHSSIGHTIVIVWSMLLCYMAVIASAVLNPRSDYRVLDRLTADPSAQVLSLEYFYNHRLFTLNYYLDDKIRTVKTIEEAGAYPAGTLLLVSERADTTGLGRYFDYEPLLPRSCDHREPIGLAIRKQDNIQQPN